MIKYGKKAGKREITKHWEENHPVFCYLLCKLLQLIDIETIAILCCPCYRNISSNNERNGSLLWE